MTDFKKGDIIERVLNNGKSIITREIISVSNNRYYCKLINSHDTMQPLSIIIYNKEYIELMGYRIVNKIKEIEDDD